MLRALFRVEDVGGWWTVDVAHCCVDADEAGGRAGGRSLTRVLMMIMLRADRRTRECWASALGAVGVIVLHNSAGANKWGHVSGTFII